MLFDPPHDFTGLTRDGFDVFSIEQRDARRRAIIDTFHPALEALGVDLTARLAPFVKHPVHAHLPRLDWPRTYEPFATWLALSHKVQGYQDGPQLNVGVHVDHVAIRLGWDASAAGFGRFEFLCRHAGLGQALSEVAVEQGLLFRVYAAAAWPEGSRCVSETRGPVAPTFDEVRRRGVWWELGRRLELVDAIDVVASPELGSCTGQIFERLLPLYERIVGEA